MTQKQNFPEKKPHDPRDQRDPVTQKQNSTKKHNVIHVTSVTLCPLVARVTYVTQFCVSVTQKQNLPQKKHHVTHVTSVTL